MVGIIVEKIWNFKVFFVLLFDVKNIVIKVIELYILI